jgi:hypothetical protein
VSAGTAPSDVSSEPEASNAAALTLNDGYIGAGGDGAYERLTQKKKPLVLE